VEIDIDALDRVRAFVAKSGSQRAAAKALGVSLAFVNQMLSGKVPVSKRILAQLGLRRTIIADTRRRKTDTTEELAS
jgi:predicted transcriptional regulator